MADRYWVGNGGNLGDIAHWSVSSGGVGGASEPTISDDVFFDANSFSLANQNVTNTGFFHNFRCRNFNASAVTNQPTVKVPSNSGTNFIDGNFTGGDIIMECGVKIKGGNNCLFTQNGATLSGGLQGGGGGGSGGIITLQADISFPLNQLGAASIVGMIFDANGFNYTGPSYGQDSVTGGTVMGSGIWLIQPAHNINTTIWVAGESGGSIDGGTSTLIIDLTNWTGSEGFFSDFNNGVYYNIEIIGGSSVQTFIFDRSAITWNGLTISRSTAQLTIKFQHNFTYTGTTFTANGNDVSNLLFLDSRNGTNQSRLNISGTVSVSYVNVSNNCAMGNIPFLDYPGGVDGGNNTDWIFAPIPVAEFSGTPTSGTAPLSVNFTDLSTQTPTSWLWDFKNDGSATSITQNPSYIYTVPGAYSVSLTASNASGSGSTTKVNYIVVTGDVTPVTVIQNLFLVASNSSGDVQLVNAGTSDDSTPIYYELETQDLEFGNNFHKKNLGGKMVVFSDNAFDSRLQIKQDDTDYKSVDVSLSERVNISKSIDYNGNKFNFKWLGNTMNILPVFEGLRIEEVDDLGIIK